MSVFKSFGADDVVTANPTEVTTGLWSGNTGSLSMFYTSLPQATGSTSGQYYWNVYNINPSSSDAAIQFAVAYGHRLGGGNTTLTVNQNSTLSTEATYLQYRNLLLDPNDAQFTFAGNYNSDQIYVINIARAQLRQTLDPGNWQLTLKGANGTFTFIDDSGQTLGAVFGHAGSVFNVASGSIGGATGATIVGSASANGGFGLVYPELGLIVLNPAAIAATIGMVSGSYIVSGSTWFAPNTGSLVTSYNHAGLFNAIVGGQSFLARSAEDISSTHYFCRLGNKEFNYSNNPSFYDATSGNVTNTDFIQNPITYPTTIGMYNASNELLAVGKLSSPVQKSFASELLVRVRLDW